MILITIGLLLVSASPGYAGPVSEPERYKVVIVGAGVSGVEAAATLLEYNVTDVILLEASDRVGGRIHTVQYGGIIIDKGAEFVHGEVNNAVHELVKSHNLLVSYTKKFWVNGESYFVNTAGDDDFNTTFLLSLLEKADAILDDFLPSNENVTVNNYFNSKLDELMETNNVEQKTREAINHLVHVWRISEYAPDNLTDLGVSTLTDYVNPPGDINLKWTQESGGYKTLFDFLTKKFPNPTEELPVLNKTVFGKQVTQIKYGEGKPVAVQCADGSSYLADHVIMTVSLGVLKKHADTMFHPALPERKTATIKALGFGNVGKVWILFPKRWWPDNTNILINLFSADELQQFKNNTVHGYWTAYAYIAPVLGSHRMLELWITGEPCRTMESLTEDQVKDGVMELLQVTFGKKFTIHSPESILRTSWSINPLILGSYSFLSVENDKQNLSCSDLAAPVLDNDKPVLLFGGEATHSHYFGTVHGALETGRREAGRITHYLNITSPA